MKKYTLGISSLLGAIGLIPLLSSPIQAQECSVSPDDTRFINCATIYNATPDRVELSGAVGELRIETNPQLPPTIGAFAVAFPATDNSLFPNNVLETVTYAKAHIQFDDGTLVWLKPETQVGLIKGRTCEWNPSLDRSGIQLPANQRLCLLKGSILVMGPASGSVLRVMTDEAMVTTPSTTYLLTRNDKKQRTEIFVFTGNRIASVLTSANTQSLCGNDAQQPRSNCSFRVTAGEYLSVTNQGRAMVKPFDAAAWVVLDPFFAPVRANTAIQADGKTAAMVAQSAGLQPPTAMNTLQSAQASLVNTVRYEQFASDCPIGAINPAFLGFAELPPAQFNPHRMPPPVLVPQADPYIPPAPRPVRGLW
jgi:hypothetical protein